MINGDRVEQFEGVLRCYHGCAAYFVGEFGQAGDEVPAWLEDRIRVLLPLSIPQATTDTETGTAQKTARESAGRGPWSSRASSQL